MKAIDLKRVRRAALVLGESSETARNAFLKRLVQELVHDEKKILAANAKDVKEAERKGVPAAFLERLTLGERGIAPLLKKVKSVARLKSGLGEVIEQRKEAKGLVLKKVRVPLGVLMVIYEARPEVTVDVAALCIKSGNAAILKGGSEALATNAVLYACVRRALTKSDLPEGAVAFVATGNRKVTDELLKHHDMIDLVIARGGYGMVGAVMEATKIPVLAHAAGGARIYVDKSADLTMAEKVLVNAKVTKPSACNSLDTILVHSAIAKKFIPRIAEAMRGHGVTIMKNPDWDKETLGMTVGIRQVKDVQEAVAFVGEHSKRHSEGIIAKDVRAVRTFTSGVDAAAVFVNASTRLHDGYVFGLGSEMGISTGKLHARGPVGLKELTTYRWEVYGKGNIR